ncbi:hypothetical protein DNH61_06395 [Paenibacillus sambharensis]|uniref:Uncharacterized protein n=1 Tax=Paenibacillus sambharensis TaxID=1803190 RepID=A0A2W1LDE0_9BACL|nr:hypothetical protein [Paenibacillus sambharensis]PZD96823.1 hypothetical protein DNH61_06395 [Paenibacillus sambharensis]
MTRHLVLYDRTSQRKGAAAAMKALAEEWRRNGYTVARYGEEAAQPDVRLWEEHEYGSSCHGRRSLGIVLADSTILSDRHSYRSANSLWPVPVKITALVIDDRIVNFGHRFVSLQFSPFCYVFAAERHSSSYAPLVAYLINKFATEEEAL